MKYLDIITKQYDQMVMCDTAKKSGADAAIIRIHKKLKFIFNYLKSNFLNLLYSFYKLIYIQVFRIKVY